MPIDRRHKFPNQFSSGKPVKSTLILKNLRTLNTVRKIPTEEAVIATDNKKSGGKKTSSDRGWG